MSLEIEEALVSIRRNRAELLRPAMFASQFQSMILGYNTEDFITPFMSTMLGVLSVLQ